jgi:hypothetical protein
MFDIGRWVIDTGRRESVTIEKVFEDCSSGNIYLVSTDDGDCYLVKEDRLIPYNKYWFDKN